MSSDGDVAGVAGSTPPGLLERSNLAGRHVHLLVAASVLVVDQVSKNWALGSLSDGKVVHIVWTLQFNLVTNTGASFSLGSGYGGWLGPVSLATAVVLAVWAPRVEHVPTRLAIGLIIGGALGNVADRVLRSGDGMFGGAVVDFLDLQWWPVFNVADMGVVIGGVLLVVLHRGAPDGGRVDGG